MADIGIRDAGEDSPHLDEREQQQAAERKPLGPLVIHEIVREQGKAELERPSSSLAPASFHMTTPGTARNIRNGGRKIGWKLCAPAVPTSTGSICGRYRRRSNRYSVWKRHVELNQAAGGTRSEFYRRAAGPLSSAACSRLRQDSDSEQRTAKASQQFAGAFVVPSH